MSRLETSTSIRGLSLDWTAGSSTAYRYPRRCYRRPHSSGPHWSSGSDWRRPNAKADYEQRLAEWERWQPLAERAHSLKSAKI